MYLCRHRSLRRMDWRTLLTFSWVLDDLGRLDFHSWTGFFKLTYPFSDERNTWRLIYVREIMMIAGFYLVYSDSEPMKSKLSFLFSMFLLLLSLVKTKSACQLSNYSICYIFSSFLWEQRVNMKFWVKLDKRSSKALETLRTAYGEVAIKKFAVFERQIWWCGRLKMHRRFRNEQNLIHEQKQGFDIIYDLGWTSGSSSLTISPWHINHLFLFH